MEPVKNDAPPKLQIFVNKRKFDEGITPKMTVDAIAALVGLRARG